MRRYCPGWWHFGSTPNRLGEKDGKRGTVGGPATGWSWRSAERYLSMIAGGGGGFGCLLERPVRGSKVNTSGVKANMETYEESGENVMSMGIWGVKLLGNERLESKREDGTNRIGR